MKKLLFSFSFLIVCQLTAFAQYKYGTYYVDGNVNFDLSKSTIDNASATSVKSNSFKITPEVGYFIDNNLAIGVGISYLNNFDSNTSTTFTSYVNGNLDYKLSPTSSTELNEIAPSVFIKYYYQPINKLSLSLKASYSKGWGTYNLVQKYTKEPQGQETILTSQKNKTESTYINLSPELQYLLTSKFGLQINFNGLYYTSTSRYYNYFDFNGYNPGLSSGSMIKNDYKSAGFNIRPDAWSLGVFFLLN